MKVWLVQLGTVAVFRAARMLHTESVRLGYFS